KYDIFLARRSFADAFTTARDRLLLALIAGLALLWLRDPGAPTAALPPRAVMLAVLAGPAGYRWNAVLLRRLAWFRETSVLSAEALMPGAQRSYLAWGQIPLCA